MDVRPRRTGSRLHKLPRSLALATLALPLVGCTSSFELSVPDRHPARPDAPSAGPLAVPSPFATTEAPPHDLSTAPGAARDESADGSHTHRHPPLEGHQEVDRATPAPAVTPHGEHPPLNEGAIRRRGGASADASTTAPAEGAGGRGKLPR